MKKIWVVAFSDNNNCYNGETALFEKEEDARKCFEERKSEMLEDYKDEICYYEEDDFNVEAFADEFANDTVCLLSMYERELNGEWQGNLDW